MQCRPLLSHTAPPVQAAASHAPDRPDRDRSAICRADTRGVLPDRGCGARNTGTGRGTQRVRLSVPTTYGHYRLPPLLQRFAMQYPRVQVELNITNRNVDLVAEGFDLAIRLGTLPDSGLAARKLEDAALCLVASPEYLRRAGAPRSLEELASHTCVPFVMPSTDRVAPWACQWRGRGLAGADAAGSIRRRSRRGVVGRTRRRHLPELRLHRSDASNGAVSSKCFPDFVAGRVRSR